MQYLPRLVEARLLYFCLEVLIRSCISLLFINITMILPHPPTPKKSHSPPLSTHIGACHVTLLHVMWPAINTFSLHFLQNKLLFFFLPQTPPHASVETFLRYLGVFFSFKFFHFCLCIFFECSLEVHGNQVTPTKSPSNGNRDITWMAQVGGLRH